MRFPALRGIIDRRILANYRVDPGCMAAVLPPPFRPQLVRGFSIGGICLIRLKQVRPKSFPLPWGLQSENAAHRIAVEWDEGGITKKGVYIPRRDTNSRLNAWAGGRVFQGVHRHAVFDVSETDSTLSVTMRADDGTAAVHVQGRVAESIDADSVFGTVEAASQFFESGSLGYSDCKHDGVYEGLELRCAKWKVVSLAVDEIHSSFFEHQGTFPPGSVKFDCALLMRGILHEWHALPNLRGSLEGANRFQ